MRYIFSPKYELNPSIGLGGVREHTDRQTYRGPYAIIIYIFKAVFYGDFGTV